MSEKLYKPLLIDSIKAAADIKKFRFVGFDGNYCAVDAKAYGVCDVETEQGQQMPVAVSGILLVEAGAPINQGDEITSDTEGRAIPFARSSLSNGFARDSAVAGEVIRIVRGI